MNSLFNTALKQSTSLRRDLETFSTSPTTASASLLGQISASLTSLSRTLDDYSSLARHEPAGAKKEKAETRIRQFQHDVEEFRAEFSRLKVVRSEGQLHVGQQELFRGRNVHGGGGASGGSHTPENPYAASSVSAAAGGPWQPAAGRTQHSASAEDHAFRERDFASRTGGQLDEFIQRGQDVLADLGHQKEMLKGTQRRLYSAMNTLGVSGDTIRMIERRAKQDKWIFYAGCVVFFGFCYLVVRVFR